MRHRDLLAGDAVLSLDLPAQPAQLPSGLCVTGGYTADLWTSKRHAERQLAVQVCRACPVRRACLRWSLCLPVTDTAIYGGLSATQRARLKRQAAG